MKQKQPRKPWNEQTSTEKIATVLTSLIGLALLIGCIVLGVQGVQQSNAEDDQANATATSEAATSTVQALTPTPTPTLVHRITDIVTHHHPDDDDLPLQGVITGAMVKGSVYRVDVTEPGNSDPKYELMDLQQDAYDVFDALYTSNLNPSQVTVRIFGSCTDKYGNTSNCQWAVASLTKPTEEKFNWKGLDYASAWQVYDDAEYLVGGL